MPSKIYHQSTPDHNRTVPSAKQETQIEKGPDHVYPLLDEDTIRQRVHQLAREISNDYLGRSPLLIGVLKGAWVFMADLVRALTIPVTCDFLVASS
ncbi:MAG: hypothetical protein ABIK62_02990, partial [candidate division WOR-3 bacterium]